MSLPLPTELVQVSRLLERDEPKVLILVGAGVSAGATSSPHATWLGLLKHGVDYLVRTEAFTEKRGKDLTASLEAAFSPFDLRSALQHAELVEQNLTTPEPAAFGRWLQEAFGRFHIQSGKGATLSALRDLQEAGALLLTTNYDSLLSEATGLPPVTWEEHDKLLPLMNRTSPGILHIHGHWRRPSSVVLGKTSYNRVAADHDFQDALKSLWLGYSWIYVGSGDGLGDPNLGRLLEWGKRWQSSMPDYFLATQDKADALARRPDKPQNLVSVGYADHAQLAEVLHSVTPTAHRWPFVPVDEDFFLFRSAGSPANLPFPSRREYLDGEVPTLAADAEVRARLAEHGWAFVMDVASVGKTTLALRIATGPPQRDHPAYYLDLAIVDPDDVGAKALVIARRLARPGCLLIVDNIHHQPEFARQLWDQWRDRPDESRMLLIATRMQRAAITAPAQDLSFFERHITDPFVEMRPGPNDLMAIVSHVYARVRGRSGPLPIPPQSALQAWHRDYGTALGAFCLAVLGYLDEFRRGRWALPLEAASRWVRGKWLNPLNPRSRENLVCLSVFGAQEIELDVPDTALPYPAETDQIFRLGLAVEKRVGQFGQYVRIGLREPGWGALILAAQAAPPDEERILFAAASRHPILALGLSARLRREGLLERALRLWRYMAAAPSDLIGLITTVRLDWASNLAKGAVDGQQPRFGTQLWEALEREPDKVAARAWETPLNFVASFLETAKRHGRKTEPLWEALEREPDKVAARAWETPLGDVASFLDTAKRHGRKTEPLWEALEREPDKVAARAWETPLGDLASFLDTAKRHGRKTEPLWEALEREPDKVAARAWETPLGDVASFLDTAKRHGRKTEPLWEALEREPDKVAARVWETPLNDVASFLDTAKRHRRKTEPLWEALEREPDKVAARVWETPLNDVASFLDTAKRHRRKTEPLWEALEREPDKVAARAWESGLNGIAHFQNVSKEHGRNTQPLWGVLEGKPELISEMATLSSASNLVDFLRYAPDPLVTIALANFNAASWNDIPQSESLAGATWMAFRCEQVHRDDLKSTIVEKLLERANPEDFPRQRGHSLSNVGWLLKNVPPSAVRLVPAFLDALCTNKWLGYQYNNSGCSQLAAGIGSIALYQPVEVCRRFNNPGLRFRLRREVSAFDHAVPEEQSQIIQLLATSRLLGCSIERDWLRNMRLDAVAALPSDVLPHRSDAEKVEMWQFNLWCGLREVAEITGNPLTITLETIARTLELWRVNLAESSITPESTEHRVNQNMVGWLQSLQK